jgi:hypothetical protein
MCDDDCRQCGARHMSPYNSDDLTEIVEERAGSFIVRRSRGSAGHAADYEDIAPFSTVEEAEAFLQSAGE